MLPLLTAPVSTQEFSLTCDLLIYFTDFVLLHIFCNLRISWELLYQTLYWALGRINVPQLKIQVFLLSSLLPLLRIRQQDCHLSL